MKSLKILGLIVALACGAQSVEAVDVCKSTNVVGVLQKALTGLVMRVKQNPKTSACLVVTAVSMAAVIKCVSARLKRLKRETLTKLIVCNYKIDATAKRDSIKKFKSDKSEMDKKRLEKISLQSEKRQSDFSMYVESKKKDDAVQ